MASTSRIHAARRPHFDLDRVGFQWRPRPGRQEARRGAEEVTLIARHAEAGQRARLAGVVLITRDTVGWSRPSPKRRKQREQPRREMERKRRGESRPCEAGVETLSTQSPVFTLATTTPSTRSSRSIDLAQHVERDVVGGKISGKINRADTIGLSAAREEIPSLADYPGSLLLEAALLNCRRTLRQASERRDPGMTGTLGDCPARPKPDRARRVMIAAHAPQFCGDPINWQGSRGAPCMTWVLAGTKMSLC